MAGLLHDVGIAGTLLALAERKGRRGKAPDLLSIWPAVDRVHVKAGEIMAKHWQLPTDLRLAIGAHHQVLCGGHAHPLAATLAIANELAHAGGAGLVAKAVDEDEAGADGAIGDVDWTSAHSELDRTGAKTLDGARTALGIDARIQGLIEAEAKTVLESMPVES